MVDEDDAEGDPKPGPDAFDKGRGKFLVAHKRCNECLYSNNKIVGEGSKRYHLELCRKTGRYFICHKASLKDKAVVCRGFFDVEGNQACQVADRFGLVEFVDPATGYPPEAPSPEQ